MMQVNYLGIRKVYSRNKTSKLFKQQTMNTVKIGKRTLTDQEVEELYISLSTRLGFIETGTNARAKDMKKAHPNFVPKILHKEQMKLIIMLEEIMEELLQ
jgi:hypothetical protein